MTAKRAILMAVLGFAAGALITGLAVGLTMRGDSKATDGSLIETDNPSKRVCDAGENPEKEEVLQTAIFDPPTGKNFQFLLGVVFLFLLSINHKLSFLF